MSQRTYVGFVANFPIDRVNGAPEGHELALFVSARLKQAGFSISEPEERDGFAWDLLTQKDSFDIETMIGLVDDVESTPTRQWLITNESKMGLFQRMFGGQGIRQKHDGFVRDFCESLHQVLSTDTRFSHICWYEKETFDMPDAPHFDTP